MSKLIAIVAGAIATVNAQVSTLTSPFPSHLASVYDPPSVDTVSRTYPVALTPPVAVTHPAQTVATVPVPSLEQTFFQGPLRVCNTWGYCVVVPGPRVPTGLA